MGGLHFINVETKWIPFLIIVAKVASHSLEGKLQVGRAATLGMAILAKGRIHICFYSFLGVIF